MVTPSGWHSDALSRDAGHDALHLELWDLLQKRPDNYLIERNGVVFQRQSVVFEYPFIRGGRAIGFADVCEVWLSWPAQHARAAHLFAYEIKPRIESLGALVRQARAIQLLATASRIGRQLTMPSCDVYAVVPRTDPKADRLHGVFPGVVWLWENGQPMIGSAREFQPWTRRHLPLAQLD